MKRLCLILSLSLLLSGCGPTETDNPGGGTRVSKFGEYHGYSEPIYDTWVRTSLYVPMRDGVKMAIDIYRPTLEGKPVEEAMPVIWQQMRYWRATRMPDGTLKPPLDRPGVYRNLVRHRYVFVMADVRGAGASYGYYYGPMSGIETRDSYDITEWIARQSWSDSNVGMIGVSYGGMTQLMAMSEAPPSLKAVFPAMAGFDDYQLAAPGGVFRKAWIVAWKNNVDNLDGIKRLDGKLHEQRMVAPVDEDESGEPLAEARAERLRNPSPGLPSDKALLADYQYRDSHPMFRERQLEWSNSLAVYLDSMNASGIPVYYWGGWQDCYALDAVQWFVNLTVPTKMAIGPWTHSANEKNDPREDASTRLRMIESIRWYDYWLKGIQNGVMDEPRLNYAVMESKESWTWQSTDVWPPRDAVSRSYYFDGGPSGSIDSVNDGLLLSDAPSSESGQDSFAVDYTATSGNHTRWYDAAGGGPIHYPDMASNDRKGLTYTTPALEQDLVVVGHPVIRLYVTSTAEDGEFNVYLEEVDPTGASQYLTDGVLAASHRKLGTPPYNHLGLPWHESTRAAVEGTPALSSGIFELVIDLQPLANLFEAGHRIRIAISGADADNSFIEAVSPPPNVTVFHNRNYVSQLSLPIAQAAETQ